MRNPNVYLRVGLRAGTGLAILALSALTIVTLTHATPPVQEVDVPRVTVTTAGTSHSTVVCQGSFGVLGLNPSSPNDVTPVGSVSAALSHDAATQALAQAMPGETEPSAHSVPAPETLRGAQSQRVATDTVKGMTASACAEPTNDQWLVGGSTVRGISSVITLSNPGNVPATVTLSVFDEQGPVTDIGTSGVLIPAKTQKTVPLNGFGAGRESTVVRVQTTGSPVMATLGVHHITEITPIGADTLNAQPGPAERLVFPGVTAYENHTHGEGEGTHPVVTVRMLAPEEATEARVVGVTAEGDRIDLGTASLTPGLVVDHELNELPEAVTAIVVEGDDPLLAGVKTITHDSADYDFTWMTPSAVIDGGETVRTVVLNGGSLTIINLGDSQADVTIAETPREIAAGGTTSVSETGVVPVSSDAPFALGVTLFDTQSITSYPVLGTGQQVEGFTVYPR